MGIVSEVLEERFAEEQLDLANAMLTVLVVLLQESDRIGTNMVSGAIEAIAEHQFEILRVKGVDVAALDPDLLKALGLRKSGSC